MTFPSVKEPLSPSVVVYFRLSASCARNVTLTLSEENSLEAASTDTFGSDSPFT